MDKPTLKERFFGYAEITLPHGKELEYLDLFIKSRVIFKTVDTETQNTRIRVPYRELGYIKKLTQSDYSALEIVCGGSIKYLIAYRHRPGILVGAVLALVISAYFSTLVWNIEIIGNKSISDKHVLELLDKGGLRPGVPRGSVELDTLTNNIIIEDGNIGFISVNFRGTTAFVELSEYVPPANEVQAADSACNIVASRDGVIVGLDVYTGSAAVKEGDTVKKGELIISGIVDSANEGYKLKRAYGSVIAEVVDTVSVDIPYKYTQKVSTGRSKSEKTLIFFGKRLEFSKNSGKIYDSCDIIENIKRIELFDSVKLPLELVETTYNEYNEKELTYTREQARELAYAKLKEDIAALAKQGDITFTAVTESETADSFSVEALVYHTQDISKSLPISQSKSTE